MQYVASAITKFRNRLSHHKSRLNAHRRLTAENRAKDYCIYTHFNKTDHQGLTNVRVRLIDKCYNEAMPRNRETQWS